MYSENKDADQLCKGSAPLFSPLHVVGFLMQRLKYFHNTFDLITIMIL